MRILYIQDSLGTGGAERSNAELWYFLRETGVDLKIIVLKKRKEGIQNEILDAGFDVIFLNSENFLKNTYQIKKIISEFNPDIVHSVLFKSNLRTRAARFISEFVHIESLVNCPYNEFRLNDPKVNKFKLKLYKSIDKLTQLFGVDYFHANGITVAKHYTSELGIHKNKIYIVNRGRSFNNTDISAINDLRDELPVSNKIVLINVARHEFQKAQDIIIDAIAKSKLLQEKTVFLSVGRNGELSNLIQEKISSNHLDNIFFLGHRTDVYSLLKLADIFVFPSRFEGLPGALIEAEASGLPIVCSDIRNNLEVVKENINALTFPVDDANILKLQLEKLVTNKSLRVKFARESFEIFKSRYSISGINNQMLNLYKKLLKKNT